MANIFQRLQAFNPFHTFLNCIPYKSLLIATRYAQTRGVAMEITTGDMINTREINKQID